MGYSPWGRKSRTRLSGFTFFLSLFPPTTPTPGCRAKASAAGDGGMKHRKDTPRTPPVELETSPEGLLCSRPSGYGVSFHWQRPHVAVGSER